MPASALFHVMLIAIVVIVVGGLILAIIRKTLTIKTTSAASIVGVVVTTCIIGAAASLLGVNLSVTPIWLVLGPFLGFVAVQRRPLETGSLLRGLALTSGFVAVYAACEPSSWTAILGMGVSGVLLKLSASHRSISDAGGDV